LFAKERRIHTQNVCCMYTEKRLTVEEIAELVNRTPRTVRRWCAEIGMPFYGDARRDDNGSWRVPESKVKAYLDKEQMKQAVGDSAAKEDTAVVRTDNGLALLGAMASEWRMIQEETLSEVSALRQEIEELRGALAEQHDDVNRRDELTDRAITEWRELREELHNHQPWWRRWFK